MTDAPNLDDQRKQAEIARIEAETAKIARETESAGQHSARESWSDLLKLVGGIILGVGGATAAYTQYEVSQLKAQIANDDLKRAQTSKSEAQAAMAEAIMKRDAALRERAEAELAVKELKASLTQSNSALVAAKPSEQRPRLAYIQFRGELTRDLINELRANLTTKLFNAPGAERVAGEYQNLVKYFKPTESGDAEQLANAVESFFSAKGCPVKMRVVPSTSTTVQNPPLEVWLSHRCKA